MVMRGCCCPIIPYQEIIGNYSIDEAKDASDKWLFSPKCKKTCYGVSYICVPKNGDEPYLFNPTGMDNILMWENAKIVSV